jgi:biotin carboxyl carrier protein
MVMNKKQEPEYLNINNTLYQTRLSSKFKNRPRYTPLDPKKILSFIPGTVMTIDVTPGQYVKKGDLLFILEAMKMKNKVKCPMDGKIKAISVKIGDRVPKGTPLLEIE